MRALESFSIGEGLAVLLVAAGLFVAIKFSRGSLSRAGFAVRLPIVLVASIIALGAAEAWFPPLVVLFLVLNFLLFRWTAMRLNDVGWSRWWALLWLLPVAGTVMAVALCFKRPPPIENTADVFD